LKGREKKDGGAIMTKTNTRTLCFAAVLAAIICIFTGFFHIPSHTGYTHVGDAFVYLAASLLPAPYAMAAGAVGGMLADVLTGYAMWAPGTVVIKALTALCFTSKAKKILCTRNLLAILPSFALCAGGYYLYEALITQNLISPLAGIPGYCVQVVSSALVYLVLGALLDRADFKRRLI
jgi:uncharacterized repeat protein (TIGR04002 family)